MLMKATGFSREEILHALPIAEAMQGLTDKQIQDALIAAINRAAD